MAKKYHFKFTHFNEQNPCYYISNRPYPAKNRYGRAKPFKLTKQKEKVTCKNCINIIKNIEENIRLWFIRQDTEKEERAMLFQLLIGSGM